MNSTKNKGRILGLLLLLSAILGSIGTTNRGLAGAEPDSISLIEQVIENADQMKLAITFDLLASAIVVGMAIYIFPIIRKINTMLAIAYAVIAAVNFGLISVSNIIHIGLLSLGDAFISVGQPTANEHFIILARMLYDTYYWTHFLMLILYSIGGVVLFSFLIQSHFIPRWLAWWGILANLFVFLGGSLQMADQPVTFWFFIQNGLFILFFVLWLLILGFKTPVAATDP